MDRSEKLASVRIPALLAKFAVPSILSLVLHAFYNITDRIFIGRGVGTLGLAGVTLCFPILMLIFGICLLFSSGAASLISIYLGEKRKAEAEKVLGTTVLTITIIGVILFISGQSQHYRYILDLFKVPPETFPYAADYLKIILMGAPLFLYGFTLNFIIRAEGNPIYPTIAIITGTLINIALDPLFIFVFSMGTGGAALATIISEAIVALIAIFYMTRKRGVVHIKRDNLRIDLPVLKRIAFLGLSPALMNIATSVQCLFLNTKAVIHGGNLALVLLTFRGLVDGQVDPRLRGLDQAGEVEQHHHGQRLLFEQPFGMTLAEREHGYVAFECPVGHDLLVDTPLLR